MSKDEEKQKLMFSGTIEIHLYGNLRILVSESRPDEDTILSYDFVEGETLADMIKNLGLKKEDLGDCFLNGTLAKPSNILSNNDRVGLFPFNMRLLCGGQHLKGHGFIQSDVDIDYY